MPGATTPADDGIDRLFTAPVLQWLHRRGCRGVVPLDVDAPAAPPAWTTAPVGRHDADASGWRFGWTTPEGRARHVLLEFVAADALADADRAALSGYLALAGACADGAAGPALLVDRDAAAARLHELRNAVNSLLMNASVVVVKLPPEHREGRFALQVPQDGERCARLLQAFADALRPPDAAPSG